MNQILENYVIGAVVTLIAVVWLTWRRGTVTVGLPLCYLLSLGMIHFIGGVIYLLPWHDSLFAGFVLLGFREYMVGMVAFLAGVSVVELIAFRRKRVQDMVSSFAAGRSDFKPVDPVVSGSRTKRVSGRLWHEEVQRIQVQPVEGAAYLPLAYVALGILFVGVFIPILHSIPSVGAVASCGAYLMVVGFCLACWRYWVENRRTGLFVWLILTAGFPAFTTLALGFIGYGTVAMLIVLVFVATFYRPRWQVALCGLLLIYLGLSAFVTYMRDRTEFREGMQAGEGVSERYDRLIAMFSNFELFDFHNEYHLFWVDNRLNQNWLVGLAVANLETGIVPYADGRTLYEAVEAMVPRILWPDKPVRAGSPEVVSRFTGMTFSEDTSVGLGQVMEFYINFGHWGVIVGFLVFGMLIRWIDLRAATYLTNGNWRGFVSWFLPALSLLQSGGSLVEITSSTLASIVLVLVVNKFVIAAPYKREHFRTLKQQEVRAKQDSDVKASLGGISRHHRP